MSSGSPVPLVDSINMASTAISEITLDYLLAKYVDELIDEKF